jgi:DNA polymerase II large subunit
LLQKQYGARAYYNFKSSDDVIGNLVLALAPHTSAGIVARVIGFSKTQGFYAHPMMHAATRRDCDGDEACVTLLVDALLNFSRKYLPDTRGATQDAPLVLTSRILPAEVDDMFFDLDVAWKYPLELYEAGMAFKKTSDVKIEQVLPRLNTELQYEGMGFTHDTDDINSGVKCSAYKLLPTMEEKLKGQMDIAFKIRAVDEAEVAKIVIEKHFLKDIRGNLRKFSTQEFRCSNCNEKFRRPPLIGKCKKCGGNIIFTISEGSIVKYLEPALSLAEHYNLPDYLKQSLYLTRERVESMFGKDKEKQEGLGRWFG